MYTSQAMPESNTVKLVLADGALKKEFDGVLAFLTDVCGISNAFISIKMEYNDFIISKKGLKNLDTPNKIEYFKELTSKQENLIFPDINQNCHYQLTGYKKAFTFFAGFPINPSHQLISGSLCLLDKKNDKLNKKELKIIRQCISQIESTLALSLKNSELKSQLNETQIQFQYFIENSNEIIYEHTLEGVITHISKNFSASIGHSPHDLIGTSNATLIHPEDTKMCSDYLSTIKLNKKNNETIIYRILHKEGHYIWYSSKINLIEKNNQQFYIGNCTDITKFVEKQKELQAQKEFYETILDRLPTDVAVFAPNHKYLYLNPIAIKNKELREYIIGKDDFEYAKHTNRTDDFAIERRAKFNKALQNKETLSWEEQLFTALGEETFHNRKFTPVFNDNGALAMMIGFSIDITENKKIQNEIIANRKLVDSILENVAVGIIIQGPKLETIESNKAACAMLGLTNEQIQLVGKTTFDQHSEVIREDGSAFPFKERPIPQAIQRLIPIYNVIMGVRRLAKNDIIWLLIDVIPVFGESKELLYVVASMTDITNQKKIEADLQTINERFKYVNMASSDVIWDWEINSEKIIISDNYSKLLGYKLNNNSNLLNTHDFNTRIHPEDSERVFSKLATILDSEETTWYDEFRFLKSDGTYAYLKDKAYIARNESKKALRMIGALTDITKMKIIEQQNKLLVDENNKNKNLQINKAESLYRLLADNTMHLVCLHDLSMTFQYVSPSIKALTGLTPEQLIGKKPMDFAHPEDIGKMITDFDDLVTNHQPTRNEYRYISSTGEYNWLETDAKIVFDNDVPIKIQTSTRDISKRKEAEFAIKKTLQQERKLNELRTNLVSTISHEFRTPLTTIRTSAELIEMYLESHNPRNEQQLKKQINRITDEIDRIVVLMNSVLTISKDDSGKTTFAPITFDFKALAIALVETSFSDNIKNQKVDLHYEGDQFLIFADKNLIEYALFNLLNNAFKYSENGRNIEMNLISNKSEICVEIIDFGIGIPEEDQPKLFNTFFRASNTDGITGTGLGLYIVKTFIEKNSGKVELESQLGKGTKVTLQLPTP